LRDSSVCCDPAADIESVAAVADLTSLGRHYRHEFSELQGVKVGQQLVHFIPMLLANPH
jgi:hypothetical protein